MPSFALARSFVFRLTLIYAVIVTVSLGLLLVLLYTVTVGALSQQLDRDIGAEFDSLTSEASLDDPNTFATEIAVRTAALDKTQFFYSLFDSAGRRIAGSTLSVPPAREWSTMTIPPTAGTQGAIIRLRSKKLANGITLVVGTVADRVQSVRTFFFTTLPTGVGLALVLSLAAATFLSVGYWQRIERVTDVCRDIIAGQLAIRAPVSPHGDEIDEIAKSMNAMLDRIGTLMETMRQVTNDVAHDLRTPLARLRQGLERATLRAQSSAEYEVAVRAAIQEADGLLDTFQALLKIAETEAGAARAAFTEVDLSTILESVAEAYDADAEERGQQVETKIDPAVIVRGDANLLTQMTANLIENALRHTPAGTKVTLSLERADGRPLMIIADSGPGVPADDRERIFGRFVRLERSRTTPGSGLGLSLVAAVAELHGVTVVLEDNRPGLRCKLLF